ncbi:MAG: gliding motility protein GldM [Bacteroidales bacterium]|nr:gliding motility protein GldM [Bacteroidales bacterium]
MAHEKLSPRQKMIGMMYLVLTAMLALNVSKETVKAFMKVDKGLSLTVENYNQKNSTIYSEFELSFTANPSKTGPWRTKALAVKQRSDELFNQIQDIKILIIKTADGDDAEAINGRQIDIEKVEKYDENNVPSEILIGANEDGKAYDLKAAIDSYRKFLIEEVVEGGAPSIDESLKKTLNTDDGPNEDGDMEPWPNLTFQLLPLVGAQALLTKMQVDVRNAETEVLNYLFSQIDKTNFKFNKIDAVVIPKSTYVTVGQSYEASVFLAATDSTQAPRITVAGGQLLPLDDYGRGIYSVKATSLGVKKWGGVIALTGPTGAVTNVEFDSEYSVGEPNATVSASAVNVLYQGIPNPLDVTIPSIRPDRIKVRSDAGNVTKTKVMNARTKELFPGEWAITPTAEPGKTIQIIVSGEDESGKTSTYSRPFRIKRVPPPEARFGGKNNGPLARDVAINSNEVFAVLPDFDFDLQFKVTGFSMSFPGSFGVITKNSTSSRLTPEQLAELKKMTRGQKLIIENITVQTPAGKTEGISAVVLTLN